MNRWLCLVLSLPVALWTSCHADQIDSRSRQPTAPEKKIIDDTIAEIGKTVVLDTSTVAISSYYPDAHGRYPAITSATVLTVPQRQGNLCRADEYTINVRDIQRRNPHGIDMQRYQAWLADDNVCSTKRQKMTFAMSVDDLTALTLLQKSRHFQDLSYRMIASSSVCAPKYVGCNINIVGASLEVRSGRQFLRMELATDHNAGKVCALQGMIITELEKTGGEYTPMYAVCPAQ